MSDENDNLSGRLGEETTPPPYYSKRYDDGTGVFGWPASSTSENPDPNRLSIHVRPDHFYINQYKDGKRSGERVDR